MRFQAYRHHRITLPFGATMRRAEHIRVGENLRLGHFCELYCQDPQNGSRLAIGRNVALNSGVMINADCGGDITIGNHVLIGPNAVIRGANHRTSDLRTLIRDQGHVASKIVIEDNVWLGANTVVLPGVTIGKNSVVGAGSVVTKDIPPDSIAVGIPAQVIRDRRQER
jgi:acetyltransferase-like isoleucine patch superfamily enzyme